MDKAEITDTLLAAKIYLNNLKSLDLEVNKAEKQIEDTSKQCEHEIEVIFNELIENLLEILSDRRSKLIKKVQKIKKESLEPLNGCRKVIDKQINLTKSLISQGKQLLDDSTNNLLEFCENSSKLGSLPVIPELKEVPYLSFQYKPNLQNKLKQICTNFGDVSRIAPIQISKLTEKPGAILVEWQSVSDDDKIPDILEYRLQSCSGDVLKESHHQQNYRDCYQGYELQFLLKDLCQNHPYSFRVCCKFEGNSDWSPWSLPQVALTKLKPYSWAINNDFQLTSDGKIAIPLHCSTSVLLSDGPQVTLGSLIEFTFVEFEGFTTIGLIDCPCEEIKLSTKHFALDSNGEIFVDGIKKSTKLSEFFKGLKVSFLCDYVGKNKVRVNIDSCDKRVTYEWNISSINFYFGVNLNSSQTRIMVE